MRRVLDVMTTQVICASRDTPYKQLVRLLLDRKISALPVVDDRRHVVGIVSEADLLLKEELPPEADEAPLLERKHRRIQRGKAHGAVAADVMTTPVVTIGEHATVAEAARLLHARGVKRLPVDNAVGRLVGIVTRSDLLKIFLREDEELRREVVEDVIRRPADGSFLLAGRGQRWGGRPPWRGGATSMIPLLVRAVYGVDGLVRVDDQLSYEVDDIPWIVPLWGAGVRAP